MKIAIIDTSDFDAYPVGGQLTSIRSFIKYVEQKRSKDIELVLIGITKVSSQVGKLQKRNIAGYDYSFLPVYCDRNDPNNPQTSLRKQFMLALIRYRKLIRSLQIDIAYIHTPEAFLPIKIINPRQRIFLFSHGDFYTLFDQIRFQKYKKGFIRFLVNQYITFIIKHSNHVFVLDTKCYKEYRKHNKNVTKVLNSIDLEQYKRLTPIITDSIQALYVGRLSKNKNIDRIILAFKDLPDKHQLKIIGDGEMKQSLENLIQKHNLQNRVQLVGRKTQEELPLYYDQSNMLIMNSDLEGVPMVILEALSSGIGIVTTPVGGIPETIQDKVHGRFTNGTPEDIRNKMFEVLDNITEISATNIEYSKNFSYQRVNHKICNILRQKRQISFYQS